MRAAPFIALAAVAATFAGAFALSPGRVRVEVGGYDRAVIGPGWPRAARADVDEGAAGGDARSFYYREAPFASPVDLPLRADGPVRVEVRAATRIRSGVAVSRGGVAGSEAVVPPGRWERYPAPWARYALLAPGSGPLDLQLGVRSRPLVGRVAEEAAQPDLVVDFLEVSAPSGLRLTARACAIVAAAPALAALLLALVGASGGAMGAGAAAVGAIVLALAAAAPVETVTAIPRLAPFALAAGSIASVLGRGLRPAERAGLAALAAAAAAAHGAVVFFPNHNPPDIDIHVRRTLDLARVPAEYGAWMRYGSQLPTESQDIGSATAALGDRTLIPYSPLPYLGWYALHAAGLDLYWAMTVANALLAALLVPLAYRAALRFWGETAARLAAVLATLDLALWHHLGRSHAPAVMGGVAGAAALLYLAREADRMHVPRVATAAAALLALAALSYSSLVVLLGLFGLVLLALLALDARGLAPGDRAGIARALIAAGLVAGVLFYFHYLPALLHGARGIESEPDLFPGRTFFLFHNESRQALRLWALGLWVPLLAGLVAAPFALGRAPAWGRPVLLAWLLAWALVMVLKEPVLMPRLLRWAKEDQFLGPLLGLLVAGAVGSIASPRLRWAAAVVVVAGAAWLEARDFSYHANSLRL